MRFVWPGTQRIQDEAPPMAKRDVGFTNSVDVRDRSNRSDSVEQNSLASEGLERYIITIKNWSIWHMWTDQLWLPTAMSSTNDDAKSLIGLSTVCIARTKVPPRLRIPNGVHVHSHKPDGVTIAVFHRSDGCTHHEHPRSLLYSLVQLYQWPHQCLASDMHLLHWKNLHIDNDTHKANVAVFL